MNLQPLYDRVLIKPDTDRPLSTIIFTFKGTGTTEKIITGTVVACGPGFRDEHGAYHQLTVKEGDKVAFNRNAGAELKSEGDDTGLLVMREFDLLGIVREP